MRPLAFMIYSLKFTSVLDTNVIYPIETRDVLMWFAYHELYTPKWSKNIFEEWISVMIRKGISEEEISKRTGKLHEAFPDAMVLNYEGLIEGLVLPDPNDRHILAAAIKTNANSIITNNIKHFPNDYLSSFGLSAMLPDDFLTDTIDLNTEKAKEAFKDMVLTKKNPNIGEYEMLDILRKRGLKNTADYLHTLI